MSSSDPSSESGGGTPSSGVPKSSDAVDSDIERLRKEIASSVATQTSGDQPQSQEYQTFKNQYMPRHLSIYEKLCSFAEGFGIKPDATEAARYEHAIETCHLSVSPGGAYSLALITTLGILLAGILLSIAVPFALGYEPSFFFLIVFAIIAISVYAPIKNLPFLFADAWRLRASNQMVLCMFYITTYMRQKSNLENAIDFAADHVGAPLSLDLKKVIWNVQTQKYGTVAESLEHYLRGWKDTNLEFVESMNLVQASLYETSQDRRLHSLEKAMDLILEETYEKMLHYAQDLKSPMTMLHMLGIILPILGLVILPLAVSFIQEVRWYHIAVLYNVILPIGVFYLGVTILRNRPTGYGSADITDINPQLKKFQGHVIRDSKGGERIVSARTEALAVGLILLFIGLLPIIIHFAAPLWDVPPHPGPGQMTPPYQVLGYRTVTTTDGVKSELGPFGIGAAILSLFLTLGVGLGFGHYYKVRSRELIKIRDETKQLEQEFAGALFQLGNRLGDGIPVELAFAKVADSMEGTKSGQFFRACAVNVQKMGMSPEQAIFDSKRGAIMLYPSTLIMSSMKVLVESSKRGPIEASQALINMSNYIKEIHRVDERLKDLLADIISGMKSQISFLTPAIAGIVIGITSMITTILGQLQDKFASISADGGGGGSPVSGLQDFLGLGIPSYYFQAIVGVYVVQITWILAYLVSGIENGEDSLNCEHEQAKGLQSATVLYCCIALVVMLVFNIIAGSILSGALKS